MSSNVAKAIQIVEYDDRYLDRTVAFLRTWSPDHPELASPELLHWQRACRFLALFKGEIVGHIAQIRQTYAGRLSTVELGWAATLVLDTSNPLVQVFAGTALLDRLTGDPEAKFAAVGIVPEIEETHKRRGYIIRRDAVKMYARFFHPAKALKYLRKPAWLSPGLWAANVVRPPHRRAKVGEVKRIESFQREWDDGWDRLLGDVYKLYGVRTAEFLNHKLRQPQKTYACCVHTGSLGGVDGYIVYREAVSRVKNLRLLKVCDLVGTIPARQALLTRALHAAREGDVDGIVALSSQHDTQLFERCGMWVNRKYPVVLPPDMTSDIHLTFFDSDLDDLW